MCSHHWLFAYGSLMWNPSFAFTERRRAELVGKHRSFCIYAHHHRGTVQQPGLTLGLIDGGSTVGYAYRIENEKWPTVKKALDARELATGAYIAIDHSVLFDDDVLADALVYVPNIFHQQFAKNLSLREKSKLIAHASGISGSNISYFNDLVSGMRDLEIHDEECEAIEKILSSNNLNLSL